MTRPSCSRSRRQLPLRTPSPSITSGNVPRQGGIWTPFGSSDGSREGRASKKPGSTCPGCFRRDSRSSTRAMNSVPRQSRAWPNMPAASSAGSSAAFRSTPRNEPLAEGPGNNGQGDYYKAWHRSCDSMGGGGGEDRIGVHDEKDDADVGSPDRGAPDGVRGREQGGPEETSRRGHFGWRHSELRESQRACGEALPGGRD